MKKVCNSYYFQVYGNEFDSWDWVKEGLDKIGRLIRKRDTGLETLLIYKINNSKLTFSKRVGPTTMVIESKDKKECKADLEYVIDKLRKIKPNYPFDYVR